MDSKIPEGKRFSHVYLARGEPSEDSTRMRRRLYGVYNSIDDFGLDFADVIGREIGVNVRYVGYYAWEEFFAKCELRDLLDTITVGYAFLTEKRKRGMRNVQAGNNWINEINRIFDEENVRYRVDETGGVHFSIDQEFETNRAASIAALSGPRYANVLNEFEQAYQQLANTPSNTKQAIRLTFSAAEGLFRLVFKNAPRLTAQEIEKNLVPILQRSNAGDAAALGATSKLLLSFKDWVDASHFYRHEPGKEEVTQPPLSLAINIVSIGASFIRWLAEIDRSQNS